MTRRIGYGRSEKSGRLRDDIGVDGWAHYLDPDERIIWQGRPDGGFHMKPKNFILAAFGVFFAGFAAFWMVMASSAGGGFWAFGLIHFSVGVGVVFSAIYWNTFKRRRSWYAVSNRRAFIASEMPFRGRRLRSWPIDNQVPLELDEGAFSNVWFAKETRRSKKSGTQTVRIGFERLPEGRDVYRILRDVQRGAV